MICIIYLCISYLFANLFMYLPNICISMYYLFVYQSICFHYHHHYHHHHHICVCVSVFVLALMHI